MVTHQNTCKFCKKPITAKLDSVGLEFCKGNGMDLLSMAACNRCADLRTEKMAIQEKAALACTLYDRQRSTKPVEQMNKKQKDFHDLSETRFSHLVKIYCELITKWTGFVPGKTAEEIAVAILLERPNQVYSVLQHLWPERRTA